MKLSLLRHYSIGKYLISLLFFLSFQCICSRTLSAQQDGSRQLTDRMHEFFIETLADNYQGNNTYELYKNFINHYFELSKYSNQYETNLIINKHKLKEINNELFKRDFSHFYYFYQDVLYIPESDTERTKKLIESYPEIPIRIILGDFNNRPFHKIKPEKAHIIYFPLNYGFISEIRKDLQIVSYIEEILSAAGEFPIMFLASFFINFEGWDELYYEEVQEIISVVFWKYLCLQAGLDFHPNIEELELLLKE